MRNVCDERDELSELRDVDCSENCNSHLCVSGGLLRRRLERPVRIVQQCMCDLRDECDELRDVRRLHAGTRQRSNMRLPERLLRRRL